MSDQAPISGLKLTMTRILKFPQILVFCLLWSLQPPSLLAAEDELLTRANDALLEFQNYQNQLADLESRLGPYDQSLLEPLRSMIALRLSQQDYEAAAELQNRQLQVMRTVLGLQHPDLVPVLREIIVTQMLLADWEEVSDQLEHIRSLQDAEDGQPTEALLLAMNDQAFWYQSRVYLLQKNRSARNFMAARELYDEMERYAEDLYGEDSPEMIPWLYQRALVENRLVQLMNESSGLSSDTIEQLVRREGVAKLQLYSRGRVDPFFSSGRQIPVIDKGSIVGEAYLRDGLNLVDDIQDIEMEHGDLEAQAMARIYHADFQLLLERGGGYGEYREAQEMLVEAGISTERIEQFFNRPAPIPAEKYFSSFDEALAFQNESLERVGPIADGVVHLGIFTAWSESAGSIRVPVSDDPLWQLELPYNQVDLSFNLNSRGKPSSTDLIAAVPDERGIYRKAARAVRGIRFRPSIIEGKPTRIRDVQIRYRFMED